MFELATFPSNTDPYELAFRLLLAMLFGFIIGYERDSKNKPVDFRAFMLVAVTSCIVAIMGQEMYDILPNTDEAVPIDQGKVMSGVLTGIGFLGAGCILKQGDSKVVGTATGASIWASGGVGLALGYGLYLVSFAMFIAVTLILIGGGLYMKYIGDSDAEEI